VAAALAPPPAPAPTGAAEAAPPPVSAVEAEAEADPPLSLGTLEAAALLAASSPEGLTPRLRSRSTSVRSRSPLGGEPFQLVVGRKAKKKPEKPVAASVAKKVISPDLDLDLCLSSPSSSNGAP